MANIFYRQTDTPGIPSAVASSSAIKGSPLTNAEGDYNLWALNQELQSKASATDPIFSDIITVNDLYLAAGKIKKYSISNQGVVPTSGVLIGTYLRGNDSEKAIFTIKTIVQKGPNITVEAIGKIYCQATTGSAINVNHWTQSESGTSGHSLEFEVWSNGSGDIKIFCTSPSLQSYDTISTEISLIESGNFDKFTPSRTITAKVTTGFTKIVNAGQRLVELGHVDPTISGQLTIQGDSRRLMGDLSNADITKRLLIKTSSSNGSTSLGVVPNGQSDTAEFIAYSSELDPANSSFGRFRLDGTSVIIESGKNGTGSYKPISVWLSGLEMINIATNGVVNFKGSDSAGYSGQVRFDGRLLRKQTASNNIELLNQSGVITHTFGNNGSFYASGLASFDSIQLTSALPISQGGTGSASSDGALTNLGFSPYIKNIVGSSDSVAARSILQAPIFESTQKPPSFFQSASLEAGFYTSSGAGLLDAAGSTTALPGLWHVLVFYYGVAGYAAQMAIELSAGNGSRMYLRVSDGTSWGNWASISGQRVINGGSSSVVHLYAQANDYCFMWAGNNVYLPSNPIPGDKVTVYKHGTAQCIIVRNGQNIMSLAENCLIDSDNTTVTLTYLDSSIGWVIS